MPITIKHGSQTKEVGADAPQPGRDGGKNIHLANGMIVNTKEFELFGRFRMTPKTIAMYYMTNPTAVSNMLRRTDLKDAYNRGRSMTVMAMRQTAVQRAIAGDPSILKWALEMFGDLDEMQDDALGGVASDSGRRSWSSEIAKAAEDVAQKYVQ